MSRVKETLPTCYKNGSIKRGLIHQTNDPKFAPSELNTSEEDARVPLLAHPSSAHHHQEEIYMPWDASIPMHAHSINEQC